MYTSRTLGKRPDVPQTRKVDMTDYFSSLAKKMEEIECSYTAKQLAKPEWCIAELARLGYSIRFSALTIEHLEEQLGRSVACPEAFTPRRSRIR